MAFLKINSYTRVLDDGKGSADKYAKILNESSLAKSSNFLKEKKNRRPTEQLKCYKKFICEVFDERTFISQREFNQLLKKRFNSSPTWYRKRLIELGFITEENKLIKLKTEIEMIKLQKDL